MNENPFEPVSVSGVKFPGFGWCIYCGSDGEGMGLRREHIIPYSLGGTTEILDASCHRCEAITSYLDGYLANNVFRQFRIAVRLQSRRKTTTKIKSMPVTYRINGGDPITAEMPVDICPHCVALPQLAPPGVVRQIAPMAEFNHFGMRTYVNIPDAFVAHVATQTSDAVQVEASGQIKLHPFGRALAKIAYCNVIVQQGYKAYQPSDVTDLILGKYPYTSHLVGGFLEDPPPPTPGHWHSITSRPVAVGDRVLLIAQVRLFAHISDGSKNHGLPRYQIVVGDITGERLMTPAVRPEEQ